MPGAERHEQGKDRMAAVEEYFRPRLVALMAEARRDGIDADVAVAVLLNLLDTLDFASSRGEDPQS
ncbi:hypothetical protein HLH34_09355 [Gluconacetobacter azotocaptans]|uniref:Uncharacterized protein n=1 Tax=Gluconacetobacter azotocaptans TaxID=142834 RepID=A0A7W4JSV3_9PROT|nr:hypothetical protein [Gluconacetobacter azotocaptans]MBB2190175.1 hypothetical protein [Gluconacetobacter azotocaptans]GBQ28774.1 hypothetical protein AA13594_1116 [Gluconacetobacter azotocaptans DSM 13594]